MKPTLIIVEDVETVRDTLVSELGGNFNILAAVKNGPEAIEACQMHQPQLVLMDIVMPKMSGIEATRLILQNNENPPKIIMLSGLKEEGVVFQAMSAGAIDYLIKPTESEKIRQVLLGYVQDPSLSESDIKDSA